MKITSFVFMNKHRLVTACIGGLLIFLFAQPALSQEARAPSPEALVEALRGGGYSLYFRHAATDWTQQDHVTQRDDWLSCDGNEIRQLSEEGRATSRAIGQSIKALGIPVGRVLASPYCRTVETAKLMQLGKVETTTAVMNLRVQDYFGGSAAIVTTAQALLSTPPVANTNTLIVAHGNVAQAATPVYPGEGEGIIFQTDDATGFRYVGRITPEDWSRLAETMANPD